jgi:lipoprotein-anchoring transpeptidase ErfK/SrfK
MWVAAALLFVGGALVSWEAAGQAPPLLSETPPPLSETPPAVSETPPVSAIGVVSTGVPTSERTYRSMPLTGGAKALRGLFSAEQLALLEKLNRRDVPHLATAKSLIVPEEWLPDELLYSPLPLTWSWAEQHPKALLVDQPSQVFGAYEAGRLVRWGPVSSGRQKNPTPSGLFHLNWRTKGRRSTDNQDWYMPWYYNFDTRRGLAFHQLDLPGRPASHACIRLLERDAIWLYGWGEGWVLDERRRNVLVPGTPALIVGAYDFAATPPWLSLDWLARGIEVPSAP